MRTTLQKFSLADLKWVYYAENRPDGKHIEAKMDSESLRRLIGWVDASGPYLGDEEIRQMPDPTPETRWAKPEPVVKPRLMTAPRINRFNLRQDGDSSKIYFEFLLVSS